MRLVWAILGGSVSKDHTHKVDDKKLLTKRLLMLSHQEAIQEGVSLPAYRVIQKGNLGMDHSRHACKLRTVFASVVASSLCK